MILRPDGAPARKKRVPLSRVDVKTVQEFERWCHSHGLALDIYCRKCVDEHGPGGRCWANNARDATTFHLECQCTDRIYGDGAMRDTAPAPRYEPKIQIAVP